MEKKLLSLLFILTLFFLNPVEGFGQCDENNSPTINITSSDSDNIICAGESVTFTAHAQNIGTSPKYQWQVNGVNQGTNGTSNTYTTTSLQNNHAVRVILTPDCTNEPTVTSSSISTIVNAIPSAPTITGDNSVCAGDDISLSASNISGATYNWTLADGSTRTGKDITISGASTEMAGTYKVTATVNGCTGTEGTFNVNVNSIPGAPNAGNEGAVCVGGTIELTASNITGASYSWTGPDGWTSNAQNPTRSGATTSMAGDYTVTATVNECISTNGTTTVEVNVQPTITGTSSAERCGSGTVILEASASEGTINWYASSTGGSSLGTGNSFTTPTINSTTTFYVDATANDCTTGTRTAVTATVKTIPSITGTSAGERCGTGTVVLGATASEGTINWYANSTGGSSLGTGNNFTTPSINTTTTFYVDATANDCTTGTRTAVTATVKTIPSITGTTTGERCGSGAVSLSATASEGTINWYAASSGGSSLATGSTYSPNVSATTTFYVDATSNGCTTATREPVTATVKTIPSAPTAGSNNPVCMNGNINLTASTISDATYSWTGPDGFTSTSQNPTISNLTAAKAGTYSVTATINGCTSPAGTTSVTITPNVTPSVSISSTSTEICSAAGTAVTFTASPTNEGTNPTYQWRRNGSNISGALGSTYTVSSLQNPSTISVVMTSNATCASPVSSTSNDIVMTVFSGPPATPGAITTNAPSSICPVATGYTFSVAAVTNATSYVWTLPAGWVIKSGDGTRSITVDVTGTAENGPNKYVYVRAKNACGVSDQRQSGKFTVDKFAAVDAGTDKTICAGGSIDLTGTLLGAASSGTWTASPANSGTFSNSNTNNATATFTPSITNGTVSLTLTPNTPGGSCSGGVKTDQMVLTVNAPPAITTQPSTTAQILCVDNDATQLSVTATGAGLTYQWYSNTSSSNTGGTLINGATSATYTPLTTNPGTLYYYVVISGTCESPLKSEVSGAITVNSPPAITVQPSTNEQTLCLDANATQLSITATGEGLTYQWYYNTTNSNSGGNLINGATSASYTPLTTTAGTLYYYVVVSGTCTPTVTSEVSGAVTVNEAPVITAQPSANGQTLCLDANATQLSVTATGAGLTYQWYSNTTDSNSAGTEIEGADSSTYTPVTTSPGTLYYYAVVSGTCSPQVTSDVSGAVIVNELPAITVQPSTNEQTLCLDANSTELSVTATGTGLTYQWYSNTTNSNSGGTEIEGADSSIYTPPTTSPGTLYYYVVVSGACSPAVTSEISGAVTVNEAPAITAQPSANEQTLCLNADATQLSVTATGAGLTYQWYSNTTNSNSGGSSLGAGATSETYTPVTTSPGTLYYYIVVTGACTPAVTSDVSGAVIVNSLPAVTAQPSTTAQTLCLNDVAAELSVTATGAGLTYQWYSNTTNSNSGGNSLGAGATSETYTPVTTSPGTLYYYVVVTGTCTPAVTSDVSGAVTINEPTEITQDLDPTPISVCAGFPIEFSIEATGTDLNYEWTRGGDAVGENSPIFEIAQASESDEGIYMVTVTGACGYLDSQTIEVEVNQSITFATDGQPAATIQSCEGDSNPITISVTASGTISEYLWRKDEIPLSDGNGISGATTNTLTISGQTSADSGSYDVVISSPAESCSQIISNPSVVTVNSKSADPTSASASAVEICFEDSTVLTLNGGGGGYGEEVRWYLDSNGNELFETGNGITIFPTTTTTYYGRYEDPTGCSEPSAFESVEIIVNFDSAIVLAADSGSTEQTICISNTLTSIIYDIGGGAINASITAGALPGGVTGEITGESPNMKFVISGTPTEAGTFDYTVSTVGPCDDFSLEGVIKVNPTAVATISAEHQELEICYDGTAYNITAGASVENEFSYFWSVPAGEGTINNDTSLTEATFTPSAEVSSPVTITLTAVGLDGCSDATATKQIIVNQKPNAPDVENVAYCLNDEDVTGFNATPIAGGTINWYESADAETAMGSTPEINTGTAATTSYWVSQTSAQGCESEKIEVTVTINPLPEVTAEVAEEVICLGSPAVLSASGGVSYIWYNEEQEIGNEASISHTPTQAGEYTFTVLVTDANGCKNTAEVNVQVDENTIAGTLSGPERVCISSPNGTLTLAGYTGEIQNWEKSEDGGANWTNIEATSETYNFSGLTTTTSFRAVVKSGVCTEIPTEKIDVIIDALPTGGTLDFAGEDVTRIFMTCEGAVPGYAAQLNLDGHDGQVEYWEYRNENTTWTKYDSQGEFLSGDEVEAIMVSTSTGGTNPPNKTTVFRAKIINGACTNPVYSETAIVSVIPNNIEPSPVQVDPVVVCFGSTVSLSSETGYGDSVDIFEGSGDFTSAGLRAKGWNFTNPDGTSNDYNAGANNGRADHWLKMNVSGGENGKVYTGNLPTGDGGTTIPWSSRLGVNEKFALVTGNNDSYMMTPVFAIGGLDEAVITFEHGYNLTTDATISVELSTDGGNTYNIVLFTITSDGSTNVGSSGNYTDFGKNKMVLNLGDYLGYNNLRVRFNFDGARDGDVWAVDNIRVPEGPQGVLLQWFYDDDIDDPNNVIIQIGDDNQTTVTFPPSDQAWSKIGWNDFTVKTALLLDSNGNACESLNNRKDVRVFVFDQYETNVAVNTGSCGNLSATLDASITGAFQGELIPDEITIDGYKGEWVIVGPDNYTLKKQDENSTLEPKYNPHVIFEADDLAEYEISWVLKETFVFPDDYFVEELRGEPILNTTCPPTTIVENIIFENCSTLDFDGEDDVVVIENSFAGAKAFEAWIRPEETGGIIISSPSLEIETPSGITYNGRWYHLAVIFDDGNSELDSEGLYIDGIWKSAAPTGNGGGTRTSIGAKWTSADDEATDHFSGWIEEVRIWNNSPSLKEIQFMMNQRLQIDNAATNTTIIEGEVVPNKEIAGSYLLNETDLNHLLIGYDEDTDKEILQPFYDQTWGDLAGYYRLISEDPDPTLNIIPDTYKPDNGYTPDLSINNNPGRLYNMETNQENTSPTPYFSGNNGDWETDGTWARPDVWDPPHTGAIEWNIVRTAHNIESGAKDIIVLGLISDENELTIAGPGAQTEYNSGQSLRVSHYLRLDGGIDLVGESQLLQDHGSLVDSQSSGWLERDQQGTANSFNYNYWSSPVSLKAGNIPYTIKGVMKDGSNMVNGAPVDLEFGTAHNFADGTLDIPRKVSSYWLNLFKGDENVYAQWNKITETTSIPVGEGYTMKGTANVPIADRQNYTFRGIPNNGNINLKIREVDLNADSPYSSYLIGNPYPSAIDANQFIRDNLQSGNNSHNAFNGTLYFWSHFEGGDTHILKEYIGGYAVYNLGGGIRAYANDERIDHTSYQGEGGKEPKQYIPVGQAFFVNTVSPHLYNAGPQVSISGGNIVIKNSQRVFKKEDDEHSVFHKPEFVDTKQSENVRDHTDTRQKIWLKFSSPKGYHREILVTADENATNGFDLGYDAPMIEYNVEDMFWLLGSAELVIQGVPDFNKERVLPLGLVIDKKENFTIKIEKLLNFEGKTPIYLRDKLNDSIHNLRISEYVGISEPGYINERFELIFYKEKPEEPIVEIPAEVDVNDEIYKEFGITIRHGQTDRELQILNPRELSITNMYIFDLNGNKLEDHNNLPGGKEFRMPVRNYSSGIYIVQLVVEGRVVSKKIIINN